MPFQGFEIDESIDRQGGGKPYLAEGDYLFTVTGISPSAEDHDGKAAYWRWQFRVEQGPSGNGRTFPHNGTWSADSQWGNGTILRILSEETLAKLRGRKFPTYDKFQAITSGVAARVKGMKIGGLVADDSAYNGRPQSQILEFYPAEDFAQRSQRQAPVTPNGRGSAPVGVSTGKDLGDLSDEVFGRELDSI